MFDINGGEFLVILLVAVIVIGPSRLPGYAEQLARLTKQARRYLQDARRRVDAELGEDVKDIDWQALDPRRYDPRRIVRDALLDGDGPGTRTPAPPVAPARPGVAVSAAAPAPDAGTDRAGPPSAPYDDEAT